MGEAYLCSQCYNRASTFHLCESTPTFLCVESDCMRKHSQNPLHFSHYPLFNKDSIHLYEESNRDTSELINRYHTTQSCMNLLLDISSQVKLDHEQTLRSIAEVHKRLTNYAQVYFECRMQLIQNLEEQVGMLCVVRDCLPRMTDLGQKLVSNIHILSQTGLKLPPVPISFAIDELRRTCEGNRDRDQAIKEFSEHMSVKIFQAIKGASSKRISPAKCPKTKPQITTENNIGLYRIPQGCIRPRGKLAPLKDKKRNRSKGSSSREPLDEGYERNITSVQSSPSLMREDKRSGRRTIGSQAMPRIV